MKGSCKAVLYEYHIHGSASASQANPLAAVYVAKLCVVASVCVCVCVCVLFELKVDMLRCYWLQLLVLYDDVHASNVSCVYIHVCVPLLSSVQPQSGVCTTVSP